MVVDDELAFGVCLAVNVAHAVAVVAHIVITEKRRDVAHEGAFVLYGNVVADKRIECVDGTEGVGGIMLVEIFRLKMPSVRMPVSTGIVHHHAGVVGLYLLRGERDVEPARKQELRLCGEVDAVGPEVFLIGEARTIEESSLEDDGETGVKSIAEGSTYVAYVPTCLAMKERLAKYC